MFLRMIKTISIARLVVVRGKQLSGPEFSRCSVPVQNSERDLGRALRRIRAHRDYILDAPD